MAKCITYDIYHFLTQTQDSSSFLLEQVAQENFSNALLISDSSSLKSWFYPANMRKTIQITNAKDKMHRDQTSILLHFSSLLIFFTFS